MMRRPVKRLFDLEIDEISLVDRSANQHADVAIAKRDEDTMPTGLIDAQGYAVDENELEPGDVVYDAETGEGFEVVEVDENELEDNEGDEPQGDEVGKSGAELALRTRRGAAIGHLRGFGQKNAGALKVGAAAAGGATAGRMSKSLGESVYEELSKALGADARNEVISKAMEQARLEVQQARAEAAQAWEIAKSLQDQAELDEYIEHARGYGIPGDPVEIGMILKSAADTMPPEHVAALDRYFASTGEQLFNVIGSDLGPQQSTVMGHIEALANGAVAKADVTEAQAVVALFEANPDAYDEYLSETR